MLQQSFNYLLNSTDHLYVQSSLIWNPKHGWEARRNNPSDICRLSILWEAGESSWCWRMYKRSAWQTIICYISLSQPATLSVSSICIQLWTWRSLEQRLWRVSKDIQSVEKVEDEQSKVEQKQDTVTLAVSNEEYDVFPLPLIPLSIAYIVYFTTDRIWIWNWTSSISMLVWRQYFEWSSSCRLKLHHRHSLNSKSYLFGCLNFIKVLRPWETS